MQPWNKEGGPISTNDTPGQTEHDVFSKPIDGSIYSDAKTIIERLNTIDSLLQSFNVSPEQQVLLKNEKEQLRTHLRTISGKSSPSELPVSPPKNYTSTDLQDTTLPMNGLLRSSKPFL